MKRLIPVVLYALLGFSINSEERKTIREGEMFCYEKMQNYSKLWRLNSSNELEVAYDLNNNGKIDNIAFYYLTEKGGLHYAGIVGRLEKEIKIDKFKEIELLDKDIKHFIIDENFDGSLEKKVFIGKGVKVGNLRKS